MTLAKALGAAQGKNTAKNALTEQGGNSMITVVRIPGKPIAKKRPRFARRGKFVTTYNPQESEEGRWIAMAFDQIKAPIEGPVALRAWFLMPIPKGTSKRKEQQMISGDIQHTKKPDLDNMLKWVKDCLNGIAWHDDAQVVKIVSAKGYSTTPSTLLEIEAFERISEPA
jgi:Holliday junction resolvase RusA-like endonuclease